MKKLRYPIIALLAFIFVYSTTGAQIIVNGRNPKRSMTGLQSSVTLSYGYVIWVDGKNSPLPGYSYSYSDYGVLTDFFSIEKYNVSAGVNIGYESQMSEKLAIRAAFSTAKLFTGINSRLDLITDDQSTITQFALYSKYTLTKNLEHRLQFQWLLGPELIYAKKKVVIDGYHENESTAPDTYRQDISIVEGAIVTGLGISFRLSDKFSLFSDGAIGISLPGKGLKSSNSGLGLKYTW